MRPATALALSLLLAAGTASAGVYKCATDKGIVYQDQPCDGAAASSTVIVPSKPGQKIYNCTNFYGKQFQDVSPCYVPKEAPYVGMPALDIKNSSWGLPKKTNETQVGKTTRYQYVYDRGYLYVQDGKIVAIQQ